MGCTPAKPSQRCAKRAMHATAFGVKSRRRKPKVCIMSLKKIREWGTKPTREIVDEEGIPIWGRTGAGRDDACGRMPRRFSPRLHAPQKLVVLPEHGHVDRRGEKGELRPSHHELVLRRLRRAGILGCPLSFGGFGCHCGRGKQGMAGVRRR